MVSRRYFFMKCNSCGYENLEGVVSCSNCKVPLNIEASVEIKPANDIVAPPVVQSSAPASSYAAPAQRTVPPSSPAYSAPPPYYAAPTRPASYTYQQPYYYPPVSQRPKQPFTITDAYIIIGFVLAIVGVFAYAFILLPAGIGFSVVGFVKRRNARTLGLSIAGIVVGVVACLIKVGMVLNELGVIPDWLSAGIFR